MLDTLLKFFGGRAAGVLGAGVQDDVLRTEQGGGPASDDEFGHRRSADGGVKRGDVDPIGERGVKGVRPEAEGADQFAGPADLALAVVVEVGGKGADLDRVESALADRFQHGENASPVKATGGQTNGPSRTHESEGASRDRRHGSRSQEPWAGGKQKPFSRFEVQFRSPS